MVEGERKSDRNIVPPTATIIHRQYPPSFPPSLPPSLPPYLGIANSGDIDHVEGAFRLVVDEEVVELLRLAWPLGHVG